MIIPPAHPMRVWGGFFTCKPPAGWVNFIEAYPEQDATKLEVLPWNDSRLWNLQPIQDEVLSWGYQRDDSDMWDILNGGPGDCEDTALTIRHKAHVELGIPLGTLRLACCLTNTVHAVLNVWTDRGPLTIDNGHQFRKVIPFDKYRCKWSWEWGPKRWRMIVEPDRRL